MYKFRIGRANFYLVVTVITWKCCWTLNENQVAERGVTVAASAQCARSISAVGVSGWIFDIVYTERPGTGLTRTFFRPPHRALFYVTLSSKTLHGRIRVGVMSQNPKLTNMY